MPAALTATEMIDENRSSARANFAIFGNSDIIRKRERPAAAMTQIQAMNPKNRR